MRKREGKKCGIGAYNIPVLPPGRQTVSGPA